MTKPAFDIFTLTPHERLQLLEKLWGSLSDADIPLSEGQREHLDHRLDELEREGPRGIPWEEVLERLERGLH